MLPTRTYLNPVKKGLLSTLTTDLPFIGFQSNCQTRKVQLVAFSFNGAPFTDQGRTFRVVVENYG